MTETLKFSQLGKEDIRLEPRDGNFEVTLPDGSIVTLKSLDVAYLLADAYTQATVPSNLSVGQIYRLKDSIRGLWAINQSGFAYGLNHEVVDAREFGLKGDGLQDEVSAWNTMVSALSGGNYVVVFASGTYRFASRPNAMGSGILIQGAGAIGLGRGAATYGTVFEADYLEGSAEVGFLRWDGSAGSGLGLGGGIRDATVYKASGKTGGTAIEFTGTTDALRSGINAVSRVIVTGGGRFDHGLLVDGTGLNTTDNQGIRGTFVNGLRVDNCDVASKSIWLKNATEFMATNVRITQGSGANTPGITIDGASGSNASSTGVTFSDLYNAGNLILDYASAVAIHGIVLGSVSTTTNTSSFALDGIVTGIGSISNSSASSAFLTQLGIWPSGPYMRNLTNKTGGALVAGDVVRVDPSNDSSVTLGDSAGALFTFVVATQAVADNAIGAFAREGIVTVNVAGTVTRGHYLKKSGTTLVLEDTGTAQGASQSPPAGSIGVALTGGTGSVVAMIFGNAPVTLASAGSSFTITSASQDVTTAETTTSTSYTDLATSGPAITLSPGASTDQILAVGAGGSDVVTSASNQYASVAIAGAAAADANAHVHGEAGDGGRGQASRITRATSVANGSTHTMKYRTSAGTGGWQNRRITGFTIS